jgi:hypothetical protein
VNSKRTKCKRCEAILTARERSYFMGYCEKHYNEVEKEHKKRKGNS